MATISDEAVEAAAKAWGSSKANSFSGIMREALEAALPHITPHGIGVNRVDAALEAMNGGLIDARHPFHASDRDLMRAALDAVSVPLPTQEQAAYALLWRTHTTDKAIHEARRALLAAIGKDGQRIGLEWALATFGPPQEPAIEDLP